MKQQSRTVPRRRQSVSPTPRHLPLVDILIDTQAELQELAPTRNFIGGDQTRTGQKNPIAPTTPIRLSDHVLCVMWTSSACSSFLRRKRNYDCASGHASIHRHEERAQLRFIPMTRSRSNCHLYKR